MGDVIRLPPGLHVSVRQFCEEAGLDRDTVSKRIKAAGLVPTAKRGGHPVYRLRDLLGAAYCVADDGSFDPDRLRPFERHAHYKAESEKLRLQVERGEMVPRIEVEQEQARVAKIVARGLETLPDVIERDCGVAPDVVARIERHVDAIREQMHQELVRESADVAAL